MIPSDLNSILKAIDLLHSSESSNDERLASEKFLLSHYTSPYLDQLGLSLINSCNTSYSHSTLSHGTCSSVTRDHDIIRFYGLQMIQELVRNKLWLSLTSDRKQMIQLALIDMSKDSNFHTNLVQKKLASAITLIALYELPDHWDELFVTIDQTIVWYSIQLFFYVLQDIIHYCNDNSTFTQTLPCLSIKTKRLIINKLQTHIGTIISLIKKAAICFRDIQQNISVATTHYDDIYAMNRSILLHQQESLASICMESLSVFLPCLMISVDLLQQHADELILYALYTYPKSRQAALYVLTSFCQTLTRRSSRFQTNRIDDVSTNDLKRFTTYLIELVQKTCIILKNPTEYLDQICVAEIIKYFVDHLSIILIERDLQSILEILWKTGLWTLIQHSAFSISQLGMSSSNGLMTRLHIKENLLPDWFQPLQFLCLLFFRIIRQGDPITMSLFYTLQPYWGCQTTTNSTYVSWPLDHILIQLGTFLGLPIEYVPQIMKISDNFIFSELSQSQEDDDFIIETSLHLTPQQATYYSSIFSQRFSSLKSIASIPLLTLWNMADIGKISIFKFFNIVWDFFIHSQILNDLRFIEPLSILRNLGDSTLFPDRVKPYLSPHYVFLDGLFSMIEIISQKFQTESEEDTTDTEWKTLSYTLFNQLLTFQFPKNEYFHYFEIRRLDLIGTTSTMIEASKVDLCQVLQIIFNNIFLDPSNQNNNTSIQQATNPSSVFINGTVENWTDQAYLIRRRSLYALIHFCRKSRNTLGPFLNEIIGRVQTRLQSQAIQDSERSLLTEAIIAAGAATENFEIQERFEQQLTQSHKDMILSTHFQNLQNNIGSMILFFFGKEQDWTTHEIEVQRFAENRRVIARLLAQVEAILKRSTIPHHQERLIKGGYITSIENFKETQTIDQEKLNQLLIDEHDISSFLKFTLKHPLRSFVGAVLPSLLQFTLAYQYLWNPEVCQGDNSFLASLLNLGEEEWRTIEGDQPNHGTINQFRHIIESIYPIPTTYSASHVRLARRHVFHIRTSLYRCLGDMSHIHEGFFMLQSIQLVLKNFLVESLKTVTIHQFSEQIEHLWSRIFDEDYLVHLFTFSNFPVIGFLQYLLKHLLHLTPLRIDNEILQLNDIRNKLNQKHQNKKESFNYQSISTIYLLRSYSTSKGCSIVLQMLAQLLHIKGTICGKTTSLTTVPINFIPESPISYGHTVDHEGSDYGENDSQNDSTKQTHINDISHSLYFKQQIYANEALLSIIFEFIVRLLQFPNVPIIVEAYRVLRTYAKQSTKNITPIHATTPKIICAIYQGCLASVFEIPKTDLLSLTNEDIKDFPSTIMHNTTGCSPLTDFIKGADINNSFVTCVVSTLYECLRALYRWYGALCSRVQKLPDNPNNVVLCPELYDCLLSLTRLPRPITTDDLEVFTTELIRTKEQHDAKLSKSVLRHLIDTNLAHYNSDCAESNKPVYIPPEHSINFIKRRADKAKIKNSVICSNDGDPVLARLFAFDA